MKSGIFLTFLLCFWALVVRAEVSFNADVHAFAEAENSALAREQAMIQANRDAFLKVASRLTTKNNVAELDKLTDDQIAHFIKEVSVTSEKNTAKTYDADLKVTVNGALLKQYMQENSMLELVAVPAEILIVPVFSDTLYPDKVLWEDGNVWKTAWLDKGLIKSGHFDFKVIPDIAANTNFLSADKALNADSEIYDKLVQINGIKNIFVVNAVRAGRNNLALVITSLPDKSEKRLMINDNDGQTFDKAIAETVGYVTMIMQQRYIDTNPGTGSITAVFRFQKLKDWVNMEKKLKSVPQINNVRVAAIGNGQVKVVFDFSGSEAALRSSMENAGVFIQSDNGNYILR